MSSASCGSTENPTPGSTVADAPRRPNPAPRRHPRHAPVAPARRAIPRCRARRNRWRHRPDTCCTPRLPAPRNTPAAVDEVDPRTDQLVIVHVDLDPCPDGLSEFEQPLRHIDREIHRPVIVDHVYPQLAQHRGEFGRIGECEITQVRQLHPRGCREVHVPRRRRYRAQVEHPTSLLAQADGLLDHMALGATPSGMADDQRTARAGTRDHARPVQGAARRPQRIRIDEAAYAGLVVRMTRIHHAHRLVDTPRTLTLEGHAAEMVHKTSAAITLRQPRASARWHRSFSSP
jgi:hypothetical protein